VQKVSQIDESMVEMKPKG